MKQQLEITTVKNVAYVDFDIIKKYHACWLEEQYSYMQKEGSALKSTEELFKDGCYLENWINKTRPELIDFLNSAESLCIRNDLIVKIRLITGFDIDFSIRLK